MNFQQAESYLLRTVGETQSPRLPYRLDRMRTLMHALGNPQDRYPALHVGGTSGKGSTATMMSAALQASGLRTGLHTKPHIRSITERAKLDGLAIEPEVFADLLTEMMPALEATAAEFRTPSYYETLLALAFLYFARSEADVAVIEVGVGGKLDGTNILLPRVSAITNVGLDHMDILGDTVEKIAADKAGIAKHGVPLVSAAEQPSVRGIIERACNEVGAPFISVFDAAQIAARQSPPLMQAFSVQTERATYDVALPVLGQFQRINAATAIVALEQLDDGLRPSREAVERGLSGVHIPGRMEYFPSHPAVVFDIAHNADKAAHLREALEEAFPRRRCTFVISIGTSKDAAEILRAFAPLEPSFVFTEFHTEGRIAAKAQRLASMAQSLGMWGRAIPNPVEALEVARRNAGADDLIVVTGSTFVVAELRAWWMEHGRCG